MTSLPNTLELTVNDVEKEEKSNEVYHDVGCISTRGMLRLTPPCWHWVSPHVGAVAAVTGSGS